MRVSARVDYAVRATVELAARTETGRPTKAEVLATSQGIPLKFLENILQQLRHAGLVQSRRGHDGGHQLARPADQIALADVIRAVDGPMAAVSGTSPDQLSYEGAAEVLPSVWVAVRSALRDVLERTTLADVAAGELPAHVVALTNEEGAWERR